MNIVWQSRKKIEEGLKGCMGGFLEDLDIYLMMPYPALFYIYFAIKLQQAELTSASLDIWVIIISCRAKGVVPLEIESEPVLLQGGQLTYELRRTLNSTLLWVKGTRRIF